MNNLNDQQLLRDYTGSLSESAFAELVHRHLDFVYSAALRMSPDSHLAEDVTQGVFLALAKNASQLAKHPVLSGWLHRTAQNIAAQSIRTNARREAREQEAAVMNDLLSNQPDAAWEQIAPQLDAALGDLNESDRDALLLRYFERKSAREMAEILGVSDEAAQKRVNRAVDRLRELFAKRGVTVGTGAFVTVISANAVQSAPVGLAVTISTAAGLIGTTLATTTATTKAIAMTTLQKTLVTATLAIVAGSGIYEARQASQFHDQIEILQQQQAPLTRQIQQLQRERDATTNRIAALMAEGERFKSNSNQNELLKLRAEASQARTLREQLAQTKATAADPNDPGIQRFLDFKTQAQKIAMFLEKMPDKKIPELALLADEDWLTAVKAANFDTDVDIRKTLRTLRNLAKTRLPLGGALYKYTQANNGQLPTDISQLKPYFTSTLSTRFPDKSIDDATVDAILGRYQLVRSGNLTEQPAGAWIITEKAPVDKDYDSRVKFGNGSSTVIDTGLNESGDPDDKSY